MKFFKLRGGYTVSYLLNLVRKTLLLSFGLGVILGMSLCLSKVADLKEMPIELYKIILIPSIILILFISFFMYVAYLIIPEIKRLIGEIE